MTKDDARMPGDEQLLSRLKALPREIEPPADLWSGISARLGIQPPLHGELRPHAAWGLASASPLWHVRPAIAAALALFAGAALLSHLRNRPPTGWRIEAVVGTPALASDRIETDHASRIRLGVGGIGRVDVGPDTRVRLLAARRGEHRLALDQGAIAAAISAPPRLFYVETPSATAVDLGCAYTLAVDAAGGGLIHVTVGWVELERRGRTSVVPFNMSAYTRPGFVPGTPFADRASDSLKRPLYRFDFERGGDSAVAAVLRAAGDNDAITLWHLLERTEGASRAAVFRRLATLSPPPAGVNEERVRRLDHRALETWWDALPGSPGTLPWWQRMAIRISGWLGVL
jgi:hypothetical protein